MAIAVRCSRVIRSCESALIEPETHQRHLRPVLILHNRGARVHLGSIDNELAQLGDVQLSNWLRVGELFSENGRYTNLVGFDVDIGGYY